MVNSVNTWTCEKWIAGANAGQCKEECDLGKFNSPDNYADISTSDTTYVTKYACSKDCKLVENKFKTLDKTKYPYSTKTQYPQKWNCKINTSSTSRSAEAPANPDLVGYE